MQRDQRDGQILVTGKKEGDIKLQVEGVVEYSYSDDINSLYPIGHGVKLVIP